MGTFGHCADSTHVESSASPKKRVFPAQENKSSNPLGGRLCPSPITHLTKINSRLHSILYHAAKGMQHPLKALSEVLEGQVVLALQKVGSRPVEAG
jgi:hypothetical protein